MDTLDRPPATTKFPAVTPVVVKRDPTKALLRIQSLGIRSLPSRL